MDKNLLEKYADVLLWGLKEARKTTGGQNYKSGDVILVHFEPESLELTEIIYRKILEEKMLPVLRFLGTPQMDKDFFTYASYDMLKYTASWTKDMYRKANGSIFLSAPSSLTHLKDVDQKKIIMSTLAGKPIRKIRDRIEMDGKFGWTLCQLATDALAKQAMMTKEEYEQEIIKACYLDKKDPVAEWKKIKKESEEIKKWLNMMKINYIKIHSENIDLCIKLGENRKWVGVSGHNIPSYEIFTSPDWRETNGIYFSNTPSFRSGNYIKEVRLQFRDGKAFDYHALEGEEYLISQVEMDNGSGKLGEFSLTDKRFSPISKPMANTLFDENVGGENGNCHIALGASFPDAYSGDIKEFKKVKKELGYNASSMHWDLINTEEKVVVAYLNGGKSLIIYEKGMFKI